MSVPPAPSDLNTEAALLARLEFAESAAQRAQRQAALAIDLLGRDPRAHWTAPAVCPVPIPPPVAEESAALRCHLEQSEQTDFRARLSGWAFLPDPTLQQQATATVLLVSDGTDWWALPCMPVARADVSAAFQTSEALMPGFEVHFRLPRARERLRSLRIAISGRGWSHVSATVSLP